MAKNWVVTIIPASPYQRPMPVRLGIGARTPRWGCLSKPTATPRSKASQSGSWRRPWRGRCPRWRSRSTRSRTGSPVRPSSLTSVSASPPSTAPAEGELGVGPAEPGVGEGGLGGVDGLLAAGHARRDARRDGCRCRRWRRQAHSSSSPVRECGRKAKVTTSRPCSSDRERDDRQLHRLPISRASGSCSVSRDSTMT